MTLDVRDRAKEIHFTLPVIGMIWIGEMGVRVDEAGQQRDVTQVDRLRSLRNRRALAHRGNLSRIHHHQSGRDYVVGLAVELATELIEFPRHLSQHVGGFVLTRDFLDHTVPIGPAAGWGGGGLRSSADAFKSVW